MSGVFGLIDQRGITDTDSFLRTAAAAMSHHPWYRAEFWQSGDQTVGLGRLGIGIFNHEPQPILSEDGQVSLMMAGELYETGELRREIETGGMLPRNDSHLELALCAYLLWGDLFANHLEGVFIIALHDAVRQQVLLTNDRFGLYPTYVMYESGRLAFAPEVKGVLCAPFVRKEINLTAVAEYFRFQHLLETKTFHKGIHLLPYGSAGCFDLTDGNWIVKRYWDWDRIPERITVELDEAAAEATRLLRATMASLTGDEFRPGVFLSGGLDSRTILGLLPRCDPPPVTATFGARGCRDVHYAERIARACGSRHHWFDLPDGHWVLEHVDLHLKLTEGFHSWIHMHGITMLPALRPLMDFNLTGWDGGTVMLHPYTRIEQLLHRTSDHAASTSYLFEGFTRNFTWPGLTEAEERQLYTSSTMSDLMGHAFESMRNEYQRYEAFDPVYRSLYFYMVNHCGRMTLHMNTTTRSHLEVRFPFFNYGLVDWMCSLEPHIRSRVFRRLITRELPALARIPYDKDEFLPDDRPLIRQAHALAVRTRRKLGIFPKRDTLYADYEGYLRDDLRTWAESILYDPRTEGRGITDPAFVRSLMARHMAGHEQWTIGKIAPLITFEMMMRELFD